MCGLDVAALRQAALWVLSTKALTCSLYTRSTQTHVSPETLQLQVTALTQIFQPCVLSALSTLNLRCCSYHIIFFKCALHLRSSPHIAKFSLSRISMYTIHTTSLAWIQCGSLTYTNPVKNESPTRKARLTSTYNSRSDEHYQRVPEVTSKSRKRHPTRRDRLMDKCSIISGTTLHRTYRFHTWTTTTSRLTPLPTYEKTNKIMSTKHQHKHQRPSTPTH
ncbi:hypothetical protein P153DRAFT_416917 [Dothidotthia symphoricarpi CBS 119687]|uniref:Uncharacterized protein n=1 Tax=Dothidotthia symphoricarpi CBS 119687 TaxID=1392245 RepID=A0A6A6AHZ8_9PLEO|nr:uncharacterized protein P153DRAFT_416917 [Dothidotthia symphoricarpi CBS 119687]KAF2130718.1 hypothetical protein P153DRAFT_416917 [Dothidotthia symphoricarpi CBS 119687]